MEINDEVLKKYNELRNACLDNEVFQEILAEVEMEIINKFKESPEKAMEAHYEYSAFKRVLQKIKSIEVSGELEIEKLKDINNGKGRESKY